MTPEQLAKSDTEHAHQKALFAYCAVARKYGFEVADNWAFTEATKAKLYIKKLGEDRRTLGHADEVDALEALQWLHSIPNGGSRGDSKKSQQIRGAQLKAEGVKKGIPDCFLPLPVFKTDEHGNRQIAYCGLYIEMKKPSVKPKKETSKGGLSDEQLAFKEWALKNHYGWAVCYSWKEAVEMLKSYINFEG